MNLLREEFDKILVAFVLVLSMAVYFFKSCEITAGWVGTVIGVLATLLTQKVAQAVLAANVAKTNGDGKEKL